MESGLPDPTLDSIPVVPADDSSSGAASFGPANALTPPSGPLTPMPTTSGPASALPPPSGPAVPGPTHLPLSADLPLTPTPAGTPHGWSDPLTGTDGPHFWDRILASESARVRRYSRPVTVGFVEVVGLERLAISWGSQVAERIVVAVGRTIAREIRTSDHVARLEPGRFGVLLPETSEVAAINCIERVRAACELELGPAIDEVRIACGWASPPDGSLDLAIERALARLTTELKRPA